ncbi:hypothetical protein A2U01_0022752, partial [Trifolium medium]|nr:hypothetical protein [Trifolium medium]
MGDPHMSPIGGRSKIPMIVGGTGFETMEGELSRENPEVTNLDLETDVVTDGSNMSSPDSNSNEYGSEHGAGSYTAEEDIVVIRDMADIKKISAENFHLADISKYEFVSLDVAYKFYC